MTGAGSASEITHCDAEIKRIARFERWMQVISGKSKVTLGIDATASVGA